MINFVDQGSDYNCLKSLSKQGLVQKDVQVQGKHGTYIRKQWVRASETSSVNSSISFTKPSDGNTKKALTEILSSGYSRQDIMSAAKSAGISWKENEHEGINWMRASVSIQKHMLQSQSLTDETQRKEVTPMKNFFDDTKTYIKTVSYKEYKNPKTGEGYKSVENTYNEATKQITVEYKKPQNWKVIFEDKEYDIITKQRFYVGVSGTRRWVTDIYVNSNINKDIKEVFTDAFKDIETFSEKFIEYINKENNEFDTYFKMEHVSESTESDVDITNHTEILHGLYQEGNSLFGTY